MTDEQIYSLFLEHAERHPVVTYYPSANSIVAFGRELMAAERERCAKLFDGFTYGQYVHPAATIRAAAIRAVE
jgi:hypothetical protein